VVFHLAIEATSSVEVFSYLGIAALVIWAVPTTRDRVLLIDTTSSRGRRIVYAVRALDWLARFRIEPVHAGAPLRVVDRDRSVLEGGAAEVLVLSRLPITAWFAMPFLLLPSVRDARRAASLRGA
jgi:uncharacterized membrane protein YbhN (UPF0104 family)